MPQEDYNQDPGIYRIYVEIIIACYRSASLAKRSMYEPYRFADKWHP